MLAKKSLPCISFAGFLLFLSIFCTEAMTANQADTEKKLEETDKQQAATDKKLVDTQTRFKKTLTAFKSTQEKAMTKKMLTRLEKITARISSHHKKQAAQTRTFQKQIAKALTFLRRDSMSRADLGHMLLALSRRITADAATGV